MFDKCQSLFDSKILDFNSQEYQEYFLFKDFLLEVHTGTYYYRTSLINLTVLVMVSLCPKIMSRLRSKATQQLVESYDALENEILKSMDKVFLRQIRYY